MSAAQTLSPRSSARPKTGLPECSDKERPPGVTRFIVVGC